MINIDIQKQYISKERTFLIDIQATFKHHAINVIYGPSGAGKTSLLRILSGLDKVDSGTIIKSKKYWLNTKENIHLSVEKRNIAYVFQDYALFPNMTVIQNLKFAQKKGNQQLLENVINTLEIEKFLKSKPNYLSGGQQQRVALARAILQQPDYLLLDEPLTAIDENLRNKLQDYLVEIQQNYKLTIIMVSHNLQEVLKIASHVCLLNNGHIIKQGNPEILLKENTTNTLKGRVFKIKNNEITVIIGNQQLVISKQHIQSSKIDVGTEIEFKI